MCSSTVVLRKPENPDGRYGARQGCAPIERVPAPLPVLDRVTAAASDLYARGRAAASDQRPAEAVRLLRQSLLLIARIAEPGPELLELHTRVLISLAAAEAEVTSTDAGLAHLDAAETARLRLPAGRLRGELRLIVIIQQGVILMRAGRFRESLAAYDTVLPGVEAEFQDNGFILVSVLNNRALVHMARNNPDAAQADLNHALALAVERGHPRLEGKTRQYLGASATSRKHCPVTSRRRAS